MTNHLKKSLKKFSGRNKFSTHWAIIEKDEPPFKKPKLPDSNLSRKEIRAIFPTSKIQTPRPEASKTKSTKSICFEPIKSISSFFLTLAKLHEFYKIFKILKYK